jgi:hypothetical protein
MRPGGEVKGLSESLEVFGYLLVETWGFIRYLWPISIVMLALAVAALTVRSPVRNPRFRKALPWLAAFYVIPLSVVAVGTALRYELHGPPLPNWREPPVWYGYALWVPVVVHAAIACAVVIALKGARIRSLGLLLPGVWLSLCALIPSGFAVAGVGP